MGFLGETQYSGTSEKVAASTEHHRNSINRLFESQITNGITEGINSLIQAAKRKARGYRIVENLIAVIYLLAGKINIQHIYSWEASNMKLREIL